MIITAWRKKNLFFKRWVHGKMSEKHRRDNVTIGIIEDDSKNPQILETVWGAGQRLMYFTIVSGLGRPKV